MIEPILSSRWVPLSRWDQTRRTAASSWTSKDPAALRPCLGTWAVAWTHPTWAGPPWEWTSPGAKAWGLSMRTAKGCPSKAMQDPGLRAWVYRAWKGRTQGRWVDVNSTRSPSRFSLFAVWWMYVFVIPASTAKLWWAAVWTKRPVPYPAGTIPHTQPLEADVIPHLPRPEDARTAAAGSIPAPQWCHGPIL